MTNIGTHTRCKDCGELHKVHEIHNCGMNEDDWGTCTLCKHTEFIVDREGSAAICETCALGV